MNKAPLEGAPPWETAPHIWATESSFWSWLRGGLRRSIWRKHPVKLEHLRKHRYKAPLGKKTKRNPSGMVFAAKCAHCNKESRLSDCEVDHIIPSGSLLSVSDIEAFVVRMAMVSDKDLRILDKDCHKAITLAERKGITIEEAFQLKIIINKCKQKVDVQKKELRLWGFTEEDISNATKRRDCYTKISEEGI